jgi:protein arginine kinase activator
VVGKEEIGVKCQICSKPATVHLTDILDGKKRVQHLCQTCAEKQNLLEGEDLNLPAILQALIGDHIGQLTDDLAKLTCPACGIRYMEFRNSGRLGCPHDYDAFRVGLEPLLERIHRAVRHVGKAPRHGAGSVGRFAELAALRQQLRAAVEAEAYEEAARIRDLLREKEATDESG